MDLRKLKTLIDLVSQSNISELEITEAEGKVRIVKAAPAAPVMMPAAVPAVGAPAAPIDLTTPAAASAPSAPTETRGHVITSPMVGTFYRAPSPGAKPFVE
ncbi:MAG: acetyl-CoA carboxylase biotin carboxyl carrier protein, partial [Tepidimonas sp.]